MQQTSPSRIEPPLYMTVSEFCRMTGVGKTTAYAAMRDGQISRKKLRNRTLISRAEAIAWIEGRDAVKPERPS
jgi:excisionase family DNA binding protein